MTTDAHSPYQALALLHEGLTVGEVASTLGCHRSTIWRLQKKALDAELHRIPSELTPVNLSPHARCKCKRVPMPIGGPFVCVICHASGWDWHPKMHASPLPRDKKKYRPDKKLRGGTK